MSNKMNIERLDNLSNLSEQLQRVEETDLNGGSYEWSQSRKVVVSAVQGYRHGRFDLGRALRAYRMHFKAQRTWVVAAQTIADARGCCRKTVFRVIADYERAQGLPLIMVEAMLDQEIDPAEAKNSKITESLLQMPEPETPKEAVASVAKAVQERMKRKKAAVRAKHARAGVEDFAKRILRQFEDRYRTADRLLRDDEVKYVLELLVNTLRIPIRELRQYPRPALVPKPGQRKEAA